MIDQLDSFLEPPAEEPPEPVETGEVVAQDAAAIETPPVVDDTAAKLKAYETAMIEERRKRQALEQMLEAKKQEERPYLGEEYEARFAEVQTQTQISIENTKIALSEEFAKEKYPDYDEKIAVFRELAAEHPELIVQMRQNPNPAAFAYKMADSHKKLAEMANPDEYEKKLRDKIEAEIKAKYEAELAKRKDLPGTLAATRGVAGTHTPEWQGPPALSDILR